MTRSEELACAVGMAAFELTRINKKFLVSNPMNLTPAVYLARHQAIYDQALADLTAHMESF